MDNEFCWNVYYYNFNAGRIDKYNVLRNRFDMIQEMRTKSESKEAFSEDLRHEMMYYYWSKYEWETVISPYGMNEEIEKRIDVYDQLRLNWDRFVDYCWSYGRKGG